MIDPQEILGLLNPHINVILTNAELVIPTERQFLLFRKQVLSEFGSHGFQKDLLDLFDTEKAKDEGGNIYARVEVS